MASSEARGDSGAPAHAHHGGADCAASACANIATANRRNYRLGSGSWEVVAPLAPRLRLTDVQLCVLHLDSSAKSSPHVMCRRGRCASTRLLTCFTPMARRDTSQGVRGGGPRKGRGEGSYAFMQRRDDGPAAAPVAPAAAPADRRGVRPGHTRATPPCGLSGLRPESIKNYGRFSSIPRAGLARGATPSPTSRTSCRCSVTRRSGCIASISLTRLVRPRARVCIQRGGRLIAWTLRSSVATGRVEVDERPGSPRPR